MIPIFKGWCEFCIRARTQATLRASSSTVEAMGLPLSRVYGRSSREDGLIMDGWMDGPGVGMDLVWGSWIRNALPSLCLVKHLVGLSQLVLRVQISFYQNKVLSAALWADRGHRMIRDQPNRAKPCQTIKVI